jgi:hypothetical protein
MAASIDIPLTTLSPNQVITIPPTAVPVGVTHAQLLVNRGVGAQSLDATPAATLAFWMEFSLDGGASWGDGGGATTAGGVVPGAAFSDVEWDIFGDPANTQRQVRGNVTNGPVAISVSGTLNLS